MKEDKLKMLLEACCFQIYIYKRVDFEKEKYKVFMEGKKERISGMLIDKLLESQ